MLYLTLLCMDKLGGAGFYYRIFGLIIGLSRKPRILKTAFWFKQIIFFNIVQILANAIAWIAVAPVGDILIYSEPANKVFVQGISITISNGITIMIVGTLLLNIRGNQNQKRQFAQRRLERRFMTQPVSHSRILHLI